MGHAIAISEAHPFMATGQIVRRASGLHHYVFAVDATTFIGSSLPAHSLVHGESLRARSTAVRAATAETWQRFRVLTENWRKERGITSSVTKMAMCPSYQRIISMDEKVVPLILREMENEGDDPDHWFWALEIITGADPVPVEAYGDTVRMAQAWLEWAKGRYAW